MDSVCSMRDNLEKKYPDLFPDGLGTFKGKTISLELKPDSKPCFKKARPLPFALINKVDVEFDNWLKLKQKIPVDYYEWATPIHFFYQKTWVMLRICGDYKITLNPYLKIKQYPLLRGESILRKLDRGS